MRSMRGKTVVVSLPWLRALTAYANKLQFLASMGLSQVDAKSVPVLDCVSPHPRDRDRKEHWLASAGRLHRIFRDVSTWCTFRLFSRIEACR